MSEYKKVINNSGKPALYKGLKIKPKKKEFIQKNRAYMEACQVSKEKAFQQLMNHLYARIDKKDTFNLNDIKRIVMNILDENFTRTDVAKLTGQSVRTVRKILNGY